MAAAGVGKGCRTIVGPRATRALRRIREGANGQMFNCKRCGAGYSPIRAAVLEFCPRCWARHQVRVPLVVKVVKTRSPRRVDRR
jgi:uncharacterized OB-fold protein